MQKADEEAMKKKVSVAYWLAKNEVATEKFDNVFVLLDKLDCETTSAYGNSPKCAEFQDYINECLGNFTSSC